MSVPREYDKPPPYSPTPGYMPENAATIQPPPPPPPGYQPYINQAAPIQGNYVPTYGATTITVQPQEIIIVGACPACRIGVLEDDYTCLGIFCAIFFFPLGILCCLALKNRRCSNCGAYFG
ncbi:brain protein I3 [Schistocerca americana]|uniref:brain protein I3 n=1 Tax=Schistocerca americana TaxID=7009 RepID=UPI001F4FA1B4|nr:brain protein I3 [Schistocerca americana]XP_047111282.1 brain protein I3 [Schistocerca piceifrons]XP_049778246.1 brain protein I3 [Schistocerca cancellata]XP_049808008.1 brain protein I3 [Schistocerca nitens]XP_049808009.1 brain protein I3 [Schistocerca nitens]XP_049861064.1 brain protein I3 [Schistocerca gregaria]XP_049959148.1 brain protein I3 [Schistocerca serialis cubense]